MPYKIDLHVHTKETSPCGGVSAGKMIKLYEEYEYSGVVITDHYYSGFFEGIKNKSWDEKVDRYIEGFNAAVYEAEKYGIKVYLGMEITFYNSPNDYLVYGFDMSFLRQNKELYKLDIIDFVKRFKSENMLIIQAHPFRKGVTRDYVDILDGIEVNNGNARHESYDYMSLALAKEKRLKMTSGSDFHQTEDIARGGIETDVLPSNDKELVALLQKGEYRLINK